MVLLNQNNSFMNIYKSLSRLTMREDGLMFDPYTGKHFFLNQSGQKIIEELVNGKSLKEISANICDQTKCSSRELEKALTEFIEELNILGVLHDQAEHKNRII